MFRDFSRKKGGVGINTGAGLPCSRNIETFPSRGGGKLQTEHMPVNKRALPLQQAVWLLAGAALCIALAAPAIAQPNGNGWGAGGPQGWGRGGVHGAPGPVAGAGLPFLIGVGAIGAYNRICRRRKEKPSLEQQD